MAPGKRTSAHKKAKAKTTQTVALEEYQELLESFEVKKSENEELRAAAMMKKKSTSILFDTEYE